MNQADFTCVMQHKGKKMLWGGPMPDQNGWRWLFSTGGIRAVLSLEPVDRAQMWGKFDHWQDPVPGNVPPTEGDIKVYRTHLSQQARWISHRVERGVPVFVHCQAGKDRTGLLLAYFLARWRRSADDVLAPEDAIARLRKRMPNALSAAGYEAAAKQLIGAR